MPGDITGVSAVNDEGVVLLFCEASMPRFDAMLILDHNISLIDSATTSKMTRTYGSATTETIRACGYAYVQPLAGDGQPTSPYMVEVSHG